VKLKNGSVKKILSLEEAKKVYKDVEEIIYFGDILFSLGDVINRNYELLKPGYVEEWWDLELKKAAEPEKIGTDNYDKYNIDVKKAAEFSEKYKIPLHPSHIFYWSQINLEEFSDLIEWMNHSVISEGKLILPYNKTESQIFQKGKRALELIGIPHEVTTENVVISKDLSSAMLLNLGLNEDFIVKKTLGEYLKEEQKIKESSAEPVNVLDIINKFSKFVIKDKAGTFIGARMGRPEKAKPRELKGSPHVLFPVGEEGGKLRSIQHAIEKGSVRAEFPINFCDKCQKESVYFTCETCGNKTRPQYYCSSCNSKISSEFCNLHGHAKPYMSQRIRIGDYYSSAFQKSNLKNSLKIVKGVKGTSSESHIPENLIKGILRANAKLHVNKDGTIRYDATELPITHFKPIEIGVSLEKLKELGYEKDIHGAVLSDTNQILELKPQDVILPSCPDSGDERADDVFFNIAQFVDSLLVNFYGLKPFYNLKNKEDLIGQLIVCMAPHNCAGVVVRILGFSKVQGLLASPYVHAAVRRDCDGDEVAIMLLLDVLLNFSRKFLPAHRGGTQDAPLVLNARIRAREVDDQILDFELGDYPLELYTLAEKSEHSSKVNVETVKRRLKEGKDPLVNIGFTHNCSDFNYGVINSAYKSIPTMIEKVEKEMDITQKLRSVDSSEVARLIIERHFIRDIKGNFNKFTQQQFRCVDCNTKYRRPPLAGKCIKVLNDGVICNGRIIFTITEGSIIKYLEPALLLSRKFQLSPYLQQTLFLLKQSIEAVFGRELDKQQDLKKWF
jgi:DNA polymerase II large subunit